ncbi:MAG: hypothetical protein ABSA86_01440 [Oryzomonas sp.]|jgi:hypothetical protein
MTTNSVAAGGAAAIDATTVAGPVSGGAATLVSAPDSRTVGAAVTPSVDPVAKAPTVDTVTLQGKVRDTVKVSPRQGNNTIGGRIGSVLFVYNMKGDLRIRYMDSKNSLVYQTPPVMMARTADLMMRSGSSVSARV